MQPFAQAHCIAGRARSWRVASCTLSLKLTPLQGERVLGVSPQADFVKAQGTAVGVCSWSVARTEYSKSALSLQWRKLGKRLLEVKLQERGLTACHELVSVASSMLLPCFCLDLRFPFALLCPLLVDCADV
jgi:hypothetical protein